MSTDQLATRFCLSDRSGVPAPVARAEEPEIRSSCGSTPGGEPPAGVYRSLFAAYAWVIIVAWWPFGRSGGVGVDLDLTVITLLGMVLFGIPVILFRSAAAHSRLPRLRSESFLSSRFATATDTLSGAEARLQVVLLLLALAWAATPIGTVWMVVA